MHPVLAKAVFPFADAIKPVCLIEAQVSPDPECHRWCGQAVVEHLIRAFQHSREELEKRIKNRNPPALSPSLVQRIIKLQVCVFGKMSEGVPAIQALRPGQFVPQDGEALAARFLAEAEELSKVLKQSRIVFGLRPCGYHPILGAMRVEEWRVYHAVHCRHHQPQFEEAIRLAQRRATAKASEHSTHG
jgi:hypothetical protein